jgi:RNase P/RNase MRP subunit p29
MTIREARPSDLMGEFIGRDLTVLSAPGIVPLPFRGRVVDETKQMFYVLPAGAQRARGVPKAGLRARLDLGSEEIPLSGEGLRLRPEDRIKRLAPRGRGRRA